LDKVLDSIRMLPSDEIDNIILNGESVEVVCEFCQKKYVVDVEEIKKIKD
jgi:molecular chaperone Hsp33